MQFFQNQKQPQSVPVSRSNQSIQPQSMSENEALEQAIRLSLAESSIPRASNGENTREETEDEMLARVLAESELEYNNRQQAVAQEKKDNCSIN